MSWLPFAAATMDLWRKAPGNRDRTLFACPELGPYSPGGAGYNISGLPAAWPDAIVLRRELAKRWGKR